MSNISKSSLNLLMEEVYLKGKLNSLNKDIINENFKMGINPVLKEVMSQLKANFNFIMTYGVGISGFIGPVKSLLQNKGLQVTDYDVTLLIIVAIYILLSKPKEEIDEVVEKLKESGLEKEISPVLNFISKTVSFFKIFGSKFGYAINSLLDILSFTFLSAPVLDFIKNVTLEKNFNINNVQELLAGVLLAISSHGLKSLINKKITKENNLKESPLLTEGKFDFLENESLVGLKFYNPEEFAESGIYYTIWDQDSSVNSIDIEWEDEDDLSEDGDFMTDYSTLPISGFIENLNKGFFVLKDFGESLGLPDPYDIISGLNESVEFENPEDYLYSVFYYVNNPEEDYYIESFRNEDGYDDFCVSWVTNKGDRHSCGFYFTDFLSQLKRGEIKLKQIGKYKTDVLNMLDKINESIDNFNWIEDIRQFTPAEEFLYDLMSNLKMMESKKRRNWMSYKDENGKILMADDINTGDKNPVLLVDYYQIWEKLEGYGLKTEDIKALCVRMLEMTHKRKVLTAEASTHLALQ